MTIEQWKSLSHDTREKLIEAVFNSQFLALTRAEKNPEDDTIILEVLRVSTYLGNKISVDIHKEVYLQ